MAIKSHDLDSELTGYEAVGTPLFAEEWELAATYFTRWYSLDKKYLAGPLEVLSVILLRSQPLDLEFKILDINKAQTELRKNGLPEDPNTVSRLIGLFQENFSDPNVKQLIYGRERSHLNTTDIS